MPLKTGILSTTVLGADPTLDAYVVEPKSGFFLRGAKNNGECIMTDVAGDPGFVDPQTISYFEDPQLTFDDSIIYGCYLDLSFEELKTFCEDQQYKQLSIFQNLREFTHVGKYGNSSILQKSEWNKVE